MTNKQVIISIYILAIILSVAGFMHIKSVSGLGMAIAFVVFTWVIGVINILLIFKEDGTND